LRITLPSTDFALLAADEPKAAHLRSDFHDSAATQSERPVFVVLSLGTTGFSPDRHEIIQIAAARLAADGSIGYTFSTYVRPQNPLPRHITMLSGIRNDDVLRAPSATEALHALTCFIENIGASSKSNERPILIMHNAVRFALSFVANACARYSLSMRPVRCIDSIWLAHTLWPTEVLHNLDAVAGRLGIDVTASRYRRHDARSDVRLLAAAVRRMVRHLYPVTPATHLQAKAQNYDFISTE
jgi:DNA polymerase III epsilon subunit-like protein